MVIAVIQQGHVSFSSVLRKHYFMHCFKILKQTVRKICLEIFPYDEIRELIQL